MTLLAEKGLLEAAEVREDTEKGVDGESLCLLVPALLCPLRFPQRF